MSLLKRIESARPGSGPQTPATTGPGAGAPSQPPGGPTTRTRTMDGIRFVRYASDRKAGMAQEVWWSEDQLPASRFTASDGDSSTTYAIDRIRSGVDLTLLLPATDRFPAYRVFDFADWLERH